MSAAAVVGDGDGDVTTSVGVICVGAAVVVVDGTITPCSDDATKPLCGIDFEQINCGLALRCRVSACFKARANKKKMKNKKKPIPISTANFGTRKQSARNP